MHLTITGTVKNAPEAAARHVRSVVEQSHADWTHHLFCIDDDTYWESMQEHEDLGEDQRDEGQRQYIHRPVAHDASALENLLSVWTVLPDDEPIVWLDGDDWLAIPHALKLVSQAHEEGAWLTYGSWIGSDGSWGHCGPSSRNARRERWVASHLKTFRAGFIKRMRDADFRMPDGTYAGLVTDTRVMFACLEMCPAARAMYISNVLAVYNIDHALEAQASEEQKAAMRAEEHRIRLFAPYDRIPATWPNMNTKCVCGHAENAHADRVDRPSSTDECEVTGCGCLEYRPLPRRDT